MRIQYSWLVVFVGLVAATTTCSRKEPAFNLVVISIDTLRADALGFAGGRADVSPNIDALAARSVVFEQAITQAPWTLPAHASLLTSLYPSQLNLGRFGETLPISPSARRLPEVLQKAGYQTFAFVAGGFLLQELGFAQGFDDYESPVLEMPQVASKFIARLDQLEADRPFFAFLHTYDVHKYKPSDEDRQRFVSVRDSKIAELPPRRVAEILQDNNSLDVVKSYGERERKHVRELYDGSIHSVDREIGRILAGLRERGLDDRTIIVITSDHGEEFWEHGRTGHGYNLNDENLRVPLIVHDPSIAPRRISSQVRLIDVAPTLTTRLGLPTPPSWNGVDLRPLIDGATRDLPAFAESAHLPFKCLRTEDAKLLVSLRHPFRVLYDLRADPKETRDAFDPTNKTHQQMVAAMQRWILENANDMRYRDTEAVLLDENATNALAQLGYVTPGESVPSDAAPWLTALANQKP